MKSPRSIYTAYSVKMVRLRRCRHAPWYKFTNKLTDIETEMDNTHLRKIGAGETIDGEKLQKPLVMFHKPLQQEIRNSVTDRVEVAHIWHKFLKGQSTLLETVKSFTFPAHLST